MHQQNPSTIKSAQQGVVLLESLVAILIFSFAVLGLVGLQAAMIKNTSDAKYRGDANYLAQQKIGEIWSKPSNLAAFNETDIDISALLPSGKRTVAASGTQVTVTIQWQEPGEQQHQFVTIANISG